MYLQELNKRSKWRKLRENLKRDDIVIMNEQNEKRNSWPLARVIHVRKSRDGLVRSVDLIVKRVAADGKVRTFHYNRPISELVVLVSS